MLLHIINKIPFGEGDFVCLSLLVTGPNVDAISRVDYPIVHGNSIHADWLFSEVGMRDDHGAVACETADDLILFVVCFGVTARQADRLVFPSHQPLVPVGSFEAEFHCLLPTLNLLEILFLEM
jgi:hypothetical protein